MIGPGKEQAALQALHEIFIRARWIAYESGSKELGDLFDAAELLPKMIAEPTDQTENFAATLDDIAERFPGCVGIAERFSQQAVTVG
ncbi:hypothetical protein Pla175_05130 [Pirellulimonas nuda]|uniref:Uncharacterized protein n=1 Tax=Pirellulimonas nuda TaxID=2528009 RepID=A0A518D6P8_9BACT|nr:hypothetical protein [Pirellulimonas nuda]QDU87157.1 hypothetical protein Pla175_05130 [Pirellulimonas nuda]